MIYRQTVFSYWLKEKQTWNKISQIIRINDEGVIQEIKQYADDPYIFHNGIGF